MKAQDDWNQNVKTQEEQARMANQPLARSVDQLIASLDAEDSRRLERKVGSSPA